MLDLGRSLIATAERSPGAEAIVDGARAPHLRRLARARSRAAARA